jgi:hypothetical protein
MPSDENQLSAQAWNSAFCKKGGGKACPSWIGSSKALAWRPKFASKADNLPLGVFS